jgi:hypothetical protein
MNGKSASILLTDSIMKAAKRSVLPVHDAASESVANTLPYEGG